jgi:glycosyltransferase involved in cell wall biosynthesis
VSLVITGLGRGGAETQLVALSRHLRSLDWPVEVISLLPPTRFVEERFVAELRSSGIPIWSPGIGGPAAVVPGAWRLLRHLRARRPDVVCAFMFHANVLGAVLGRLAGVPVIVASIRNEHFGSRWREGLEAMAQRLSDVTVVNSTRVAASLRARRIVGATPCRVIPNAVDVARFTPDATVTRAVVRQQLGISAGTFLWLAVGSLEPQKDHATLLRAVATLRDRYPGLRLAVAGHGPLRDALGRLAEDLGLSDRVAWLGLRHDVPALLAACDAFVLASRWEGSPNALLEALVSGVPVVATAVGGVRDLVEDGRSGFLATPGDVAAVAGAMEQVLSLEPEARQQLGRRGRDAIRTRHDAPAVLEQWRTLLHDAWRSRRSSRAAAA